MKYSLRSLMIVVTLLAVVGGGRAEYLRRMAAFHEREGERLAVELQRLTGWHPRKPGFVLFRMSEVEGLLLSQVRAHEDLALEYRQAVVRPWVSIKSPQPPTTSEEVWLQTAKLVEAKMGPQPAP